MIENGLVSGRGISLYVTHQGKVMGFYSSSIMHGATCPGELGESFIDAVLSEQVV